MSDPVMSVDVAERAERARGDPIAHRQRQTMEIALRAPEMTGPLQTKVFPKGGSLMGLAQDSPTQTTGQASTLRRPSRLKATPATGSESCWTESLDFRGDDSRFS